MMKGYHSDLLLVLYYSLLHLHQECSKGRRKKIVMMAPTPEIQKISKIALTITRATSFIKYQQAHTIIN